MEFDLTKTYNNERVLLIWMGFYPRKSRKILLIDYFCAAMTLFFSLSHLLYSTAFIYLEFGNITKITESLLIFGTVASYLIKLSIFVMHYGDMLDLEEFLQNDCFYDFSGKKLENLHSSIGTCMKLGHIFRGMCGIVIVFYGIYPFFSSESVLALPGSFPWDTEKYHFSTILFQCYCLLICSITNSSLDIIVIILITVASVELDILNENLRDMDYTRDEHILNKEMEKHVEHNIKISEFIRKFEKIFTYGVFIQFVASVLGICLTGFQLMVIEEFNIQSALLVNYLSAITCQVAMYCWYGHNPITKSSLIAESCYMTNWYRAPLSTRKYIILLMERAKRPMILTAGKFFTLSLQTFVMILRSAYSLFALLQRVYSGV